MTPRPGRLAAMVLAFAVILGGCTPPAVQPNGGRDYIGQLGTSGSAVFVNGAPASTGTRIFSGDKVTTGPNSSAVVLFASGGYFQLDQNTDPFFSWQTIEDVRCILVGMVEGQAYEDDTPACVSSPAADALAHSIVNIQVSSSATVFTLLSGNLMLSRPVRQPLVPGQEVAAQANNPRVRITSLSPAQLAERVAWRARFPFIGWCVGQGGAQPARLGDCRGGFSFTRPGPTIPTIQPPPIRLLPPPVIIGPQPREPTRPQPSTVRPGLR